MSKEAARRKRAKAIKTLRECGMSDGEIEAELGFSIDSSPQESEIIDVEIVSVEDETHDNVEPVTEMRPEARQAPLPARIAFPNETDSNTTKPFSKYSEEWWGNAKPEVQQRRCKAHSIRTGEQCRQQALIGTTVCRWHGGAAPQVKAAARRRLENAADRMARNLLGLATDAESEPVRLGATNSALDRVGITKPQEVVLSQGKPYEEVFDEIAGVSREESRRARGFLEPDAGSTNIAPASASRAEEPVEPSDTSDYADLEPEYVPRDDVSPTYQHRADPAGDDIQSVSEPNAPAQSTRRTGSDRERHAQRAVHITGDDALRVSGQLTREQLALESPHKRYKRPW